MSQKEETCSLHGEGKGKKRWLRKQRDQSRVSKKICLVKMFGPSWEKSKKNGGKSTPCPIRYTCDLHGHEITSEDLEIYLNTVELTSEEVKNHIHFLTFLQLTIFNSIA